MNYGMIATGNHCNSDSLRISPLPAVKSSDIAPHFGKNVLPHGSHEWLPYSKDEVRLKTVNNNLSLSHIENSRRRVSGGGFWVSSRYFR